MRSARSELAKQWSREVKEHAGVCPVKGAGEAVNAERTKDCEE